MALRALAAHRCGACYRRLGRQRLEVAGEAGEIQQESQKNAGFPLRGPLRCPLNGPQWYVGPKRYLHQ